MKNPVTITHLTSAHDRYDIRVFKKMCCSLAKNTNFQVNLIVADGKGDELIENVNIWDVGAKTGGRFSRMTRTVYRVYKRALELDSEIYQFHDPELMPVGYRLKKCGKKVIYDIHENIDLQILEKYWIPVYLRKSFSFFFRKIEDFVCRRLDLLFVPQEAMFNKYNKLSKTAVIANFPDAIPTKFSSKEFNKYALLYSGGISAARGIWNMLNLILELKKLDRRYSLTIAGPINESLLQEVKAHEAWQHINYLGMLSNEEIIEVYNNCSIGLILFNNVGQYFMAYSLKLFEYMRSGLIIIVPDFGDWIPFNSSYNVGINVNTSDSFEMARTIDALDEKSMQDIAKSNILKVGQHFTWESQEKKLNACYYEFINSNY